MQALSEAFNRGCDARLVGLALSDCPYTAYGSSELKRWWIGGWDHVHRYWGSKAKWPVKPLPPVRNL